MSEKYYSVCFAYDDVGVDYSDPDVPDMALRRAERVVRETLAKHGLESAHQYCWPDGSIYRYIRTSFKRETLEALLRGSRMPHIQSVWAEPIAASHTHFTGVQVKTLFP